MARPDRAGAPVGGGRRRLSNAPAGTAETVLVSDLPIRRIGFGAMRLTGSGTWGPPKDQHAAKEVLRRALELGVTLIDTADAYGPVVNERQIAEALHPYPDGLVIATKAARDRGRSSGDGMVGPRACGRPARPA
jgi:pyridoxine 4-dehydrogenase